jgi:sugar phosphate isomerase/epimerase
MTRRHALRLGLAATVSNRPTAAQPPIQSTFAGVTLGVQGYSFRDLTLGQAIRAMADIGFGTCEANYIHMEPAAIRRDRARIREWRLSVPLSEFEKAAGDYRAAGIEPWAYTYTMRAEYTDAELERGFEMARAMGVRSIASTANVSVAKRIDMLAKKYKIRVGIHNHSNAGPDELATPESFSTALKGSSDYLGITLDIGHFVAAGFDPIAFLRQNHSRVFGIHIKDRKRGQGPNVPFGQGDTPIVQVLRLIRDQKWKIHADIEYEYQAPDTVAEVRKCFVYCKKALLA